MKKMTVLLLCLILVLSSIESVFAFDLNAIGQNILEDKENNNTPQTAQMLKSGQTISGYLDLDMSLNQQDLEDYMDIDYFKFVLTEKSDVMCVVLGEVSSDDYMLAVFSDANDKTIVTSECFVANGNHEALAVGENFPAGTYYLCILSSVDDVKYNRVGYAAYFEVEKSSSFQQESSKTGNKPNNLNFKNFKVINSYINQFSDVPSTLWCAEYVKQAYELGLVNGKTATQFSPNGNITIAETIALACRLNSIYNTGEAEFVQGKPWYQVYVDYASVNGIISDSQFDNFEKTATRSEFASIMYKALPADTFTTINSISTIPDVTGNEPFSTSVFKLYSSGILTGSDKYGTFNPNSNISRAEVVAILTRMAVPENRKTFVLESKPILAESISFANQTYQGQVGDRFYLTANVVPVAASENVTYSSSNPNVVTVDNSGYATAISAGTAKITASADGKFASCTVTVKEKVISIYDCVGPTYQETIGNFRIMPVVEQNSVGGAKVKWEAENISGKQINYYTVYFTLLDNFGSPVKDEITGKTDVSCKVQGPVKPGEKLLIYNVIGYHPFCTAVRINSIKLEFADGSVVSGDYVVTIKGGNMNNDGF